MEEKLIVLTEAQFNTICRRYYHQGWLEGKEALKQNIQQELLLLKNYRLESFKNRKI